MDYRLTCVPRGAHHSVGTFGGNCHLWSIAGVHGSKSGVVDAFLVLAGGGWRKKLFHRCGRAQLRLRILLWIVDQLADLDEVRRISVVSGGTYLCDVQNAILYLAAEID